MPAPVVTSAGPAPRRHGPRGPAGRLVLQLAVSCGLAVADTDDAQPLLALGSRLLTSRRSPA